MKVSRTRTIGGYPVQRTRNSGIDVWMPLGAPDDPLNELLERAARALKLEDERIRQALASSTEPEAYARCGHGLSYWVFEHNLLLPIFLDWVRTHVVRWDEPVLRDLGQPSGVSTPAEAIKRSKVRVEDSKRRLVDLQLVLPASERGDDAQLVRFEAKWWVLKRAARHVKADVKKLREMSGSGDRAVLLTFWYGVDAKIDDDLGEANTPSGTKPLMAATFDTTVYPWWLEEKNRTLTDGYFALVAYELSTIG